MKALYFFIFCLFLSVVNLNAQTVTIKTKGGNEFVAKIADFRQGKLTYSEANSLARKTIEASELDDDSFRLVRDLMSVKCMPSLKVKERVSTKSDTEKSVYFSNNQTKSVTKKKEYEISINTTSPYERDLFLFWIIIKGDARDMPESIVNVKKSKKDRAYSYYGTKRYQVDEGGIKSKGEIITIGGGKTFNETVEESATSVTTRLADFGSSSNMKAGTDKISVAVLLYSREGKILAEYNNGGALMEALKKKYKAQIQEEIDEAFEEYRYEIE